MLRSGPFSDEVVVGLLNTRFVPFYFDLGKGSPAGDDAAKAFVVAVKEELGGNSVPTPPVLFMTADGELVGEVSNYATEGQMIDALRGVLKEHPELARSTPAEARSARLERARIAHWLGRDDAASELLEGDRTPAETLLLAQIARRAGAPDAALARLGELDPDEAAADLALEHGLLAWSRGDHETMLTDLEACPVDDPRAAEARYYSGVAQFHLGRPEEARATWKALVEAFGEDRWSYRADWAYSQTNDEGIAKTRSSFSMGASKSLLGRHGYMGRRNPDLKARE